MIIVLAKIVAKEGMKNNIIKESKELIKKTRSEKGCVEYNLYDQLDEDNSLLFFEKWENKDCLTSHLNQVHFTKFGEAIEDYLAKELEISVYSSEPTNL